MVGLDAQAIAALTRGHRRLEHAFFADALHLCQYFVFGAYQFDGLSLRLQRTNDTPAALFLRAQVRKRIMVPPRGYGFFNQGKARLSFVVRIGPSRSARRVRPSGFYPICPGSCP